MHTSYSLTIAWVVCALFAIMDAQKRFGIKKVAKEFNRKELLNPKVMEGSVYVSLSIFAPLYLLVIMKIIFHNCSVYFKGMRLYKNREEIIVSLISGINRDDDALISILCYEKRDIIYYNMKMHIYLLNCFIRRVVIIYKELDNCEIEKHTIEDTRNFMKEHDINYRMLLDVYEKCLDDYDKDKEIEGMMDRL